MFLLHKSCRYRFNFKSFSTSNVRCSKKKEGSDDKKLSFSSTVLLPKTDFPVHLSAAAKLKRDSQVHEAARFDSLYAWQRKERAGAEEFVLHDGPPYANGKPHMGHALNKILKDMIIRHKLLTGKQVNYIPGWDCHGLPIELKAMGDHAKNSGLSATEIREKARRYAQEAIAGQRAAFKEWGVMADWENECYFTYKPSYITKQLKAFFDLYQKGLVFRDYKPVYWSPSSRTALAEAELEYKADHISPSVYVTFALTTLSEPLVNIIPPTSKFIIWTTTPWTLPLNEAIAFSPNHSYTLAYSSVCQEYYVLATQLVPSLTEILGLKAHKNFPGSYLAGCQYLHPLNGKQLPALPGSHVTMDKGTGLVHTAPAHGPDDFLMALKHNLPMECLVNEEGRYMEGVGANLAGLEVLGEGQNRVQDLLGDAVVHKELYQHSYPYDWRTKKPVILKASLQWFIDTDKIKQLALDVIQNVEIIPYSQAHGMISQLKKRPYWCISRQRVWGVPIPVFYTQDDKPLITQLLLFRIVVLHIKFRNTYIRRETVNRLCTLIEKHGSDAWWTLSTEELLGFPSDAKKGKDILDIWFDSGVSWYSVLGGKTADLYVEGVDQFGGWFQSSLLTSVALQEKAPYKKLYVHGFTLDDQGKKMSKSLGNVIDPQEVIRGGENAKQKPAYGIDALRWWVACHASGGASAPVGKALLQSSAEDVQKLRAILKFMLGALHGYTNNQTSATHPVDQYMLHLCNGFKTKVLELYNNYEFKKICSVLLHFVNNDVSAFYCHSVKDRLYCERADSEARLSCQFTLNCILEVIIHTIAPLLPHIAEEVGLYHHEQRNFPLFYSGGWEKVNMQEPTGELIDSVKMGCQIRDRVMEVLKSSNSRLYEAHLQIHPSLDLRVLQEKTDDSESPLCELLQVSRVLLLSDLEQKDAIDTLDGKGKLVLKKSERFLCPRCRKFTANSPEQLCARCTAVVASLQ